MTAVLDACGEARAIIGGLSLGGVMSLAFHLAYPERVHILTEAVLESREFEHKMAPMLPRIK